MCCWPASFDGTVCLSRYRDLPGGHPETRALAVATVQPNALPPAFWGEQAPLNSFATPEDLCLEQLTAHMDSVRKADLLVFPELPRFDCRDGEFVRSGLQKALQGLKIPSMLPSAEFVYGEKSRQAPESRAFRQMVTTPILAKYVSVFFMPPGAERPMPVYRKIKPVPFSEASPFGLTLPWRKASNRLRVSRGDGIRLIRVRDLDIQPLICFESGFSSLVRQGVLKGAEMLVEFSNDGWFASRDAEMEHLDMAIFRAVESRRPIVRCSNSGSGAHVSAGGEIIPGTLTPHGAPCVTRARVLCPEGLTLYLRQGEAWLWILGGIVAWQAGVKACPHASRSLYHKFRLWNRRRF